MNISQSNKIFSLENIFISLSVICIYAGYLIFNYPVDMVINDEIYLLLDIRQNNLYLIGIFLHKIRLVQNGLI